MDCSDSEGKGPLLRVSVSYIEKSFYSQRMVLKRLVMLMLNKGFYVYRE